MLHIRKRSFDTLADVHEALLTAIRLELATLPPYLTALYSIKPGKNAEIAAVLKSIVMEEMLHLCFGCNILNAIGGKPVLNDPAHVVKFPGPLPGDIGTQPGKRLIVPLRRFSLGLVRDVFMVIEEPEDPLRFRNAPAERRKYHTIGEFYLAIGDEIKRQGKKIFTGDPKRQLTGQFGKNHLFAIKDADSAMAAIRIIIEQGEGTARSPLDLEHGLAHYYLFSQIVTGRCLAPDAKSENGWAYRGPHIPFDADGVFPMADDPPTVHLPPGSIVAQYAEQFDRTYTTLLNALHVSVNGDPDHLGASVGVMFALRIEAQRLMSTPLPGRNVHAGPRWRFVSSW